MKKANKTAANVAIIANESESVTPVIIDSISEPTTTVVFRVTQTGKSEFTMEHSITAKQKDVTATGLASKLAFALADSLYKLIEDTLKAKEQHGYYLTSFRPKSVFCVSISIDGVQNFIAMNTKGADAIRLVKSGKIVSRSVLVQKLTLLAGIAKANETFANVISFELEVDKMIANETETLLKLEAVNETK